MPEPAYKTLEDAIGGTPLVRLQRLPGAAGAARGNVILGKLEGNNPAGSVKDRPAISMIRRAEERGDIRPGDTLIEATSGNTGIALAMAAAIRGYRMVLIMPEDLSIERAQTMKAFGAELILTPKSGGMEYARDLAEQMQRDGKGRVLDQFANADNPRVHYETTGPEIWADTGGRVTHFVSAMGTTGTITGVSRFLKEKNPAVRIVGAQPAEGSRIPGIRKWPEAYLPKIYDAEPRRRTGAGEPGRRRGHGAPPGARGGPVRRHLGRRRLLGGAADRRRRCATPPSSSSSATAATATCPPASSRPERARCGQRGLQVLPELRHGAGAHRGRGGRRAEGAACAARPAAGRTGTTRRRCWRR